MDRNKRLRANLTPDSKTRPLIGNQPSESTGEDPDDLRARIEAFVRFKNITQNQRDRLNDLMNRRSAQKWDAAKKARMVRKFVAAQRDLDEAVTTIDQLEFRLSQVTTA